MFIPDAVQLVGVVYCQAVVPIEVVSKPPFDIKLVVLGAEEYDPELHALQANEELLPNKGL